MLESVILSQEQAISALGDTAYPLSMANLSESMGDDYSAGIYRTGDYMRDQRLRALGPCRLHLIFVYGIW